MRYIAALETAPRRIYTGAIGFVIGKRAQFNVAIRTVLIDRKTGLAEYGVGGGIVWDSTPAGEYEECRIKTRLLTQPRPRFALLESLLWVPTGEYYLHDAHLRRLAESAEYFGFPFQDENVRSALVDAAADLFAAPHKVRMLLFIDGRIEISASPLEPAPPGTDIPGEPGASRADIEPVELRLAAGPVTSSEPFLYHKTTNRQAYAVARRGLPPGCEAVFYNERGELTESEIANLVLRIGGQLLTPPVSAGLLPGVMRAHLLARGEIEEAPLHIDDLARAEEIYLINSVRKWRLGELASISV